MITTIIIDDNDGHRNHLETLLKEFAEIDIVKLCKSGFEGLEAIAFQNPQLIFLDIAMPAMDGFEMLEKIREKNFFTIFITDGEHEKRAINMVGMYYLKKPFDKEKLHLSLDRYKEEYGKKLLLEQYKVMEENGKKNNEKVEQILLNDNIRKGRYFFSTDQIVYCEAVTAIPYTEVHLASGQTCIETKNIGHFEKLLTPLNFEKPHKSYLLNMKYFKSYSKKNNEIEIEYYPETKIPLSRDRKKYFELKYRMFR